MRVFIRYNEGMKNTHLEHPEDMILTGDLSVLDWFTGGGHVSLKYDGAPAVVWGNHPKTHRFFVGTKSVFNKVKIKINYSHSDIDSNHTGEVAKILHACLDHIPHHLGYMVFQGDFIGFGGSDEYKPNTLTYKFPEVVEQKIIIAPHTQYITTQCESNLANAQAHPMKSFPYYFNWEKADECLFVGTNVREREDDPISNLKKSIDFIRHMAGGIQFVDQKTANELKEQINKDYREGREVDPKNYGIHGRLINYWKLVQESKADVMRRLTHSDPVQAYLGYDKHIGEGFVMTNKFGMYKLVYRHIFSYANFNSGRFVPVG